MTRFVVDASAVAALLLEEITEPSWVTQLKFSGAIAPWFFSLEIANALLVAVRGKRADESYRVQRLADAAQLPIHLEAPIDWTALERVSLLAIQHGLSVYDAIYLDLALRTGLPLASYDKRLVEAARKSGVAVIS